MLNSMPILYYIAKKYTRTCKGVQNNEGPRSVTFCY